MVTHQHLIIFIFHIFYTILCTSVCRYDEPYILWNNTNFPNETGYYVRDYLDLVQTGTPLICGDHSPTFNGTWIYTLNRPNASSLYLFQFHDGNSKNRLMISKTPCAKSQVIFDTDATETDPILDGTNCDWTSIDDKNIPAIPWRYPNNNPLPGQTILCDRTNGCDTPNPTTTPTISPIPTTAIPSADPTTPYPSISPSVSTDAPSKTPTKSPTVKPTNLPTFLKPLYDQPPCVAMMVTNLHKAFPMQAEYQEKFNEIKNYAYNQRRVWSNGGNKLEIFYTNRYEPGRWVISNGTYHLINNGDQLVDGGINQSFPGDDGGHGLYDHFPNDNPIGIADVQYTIRFVCQNSSIHGTRYPTRPPSPAPSLSPTLTPSLAPSASPTTAPVALCGKLVFQNGENTANTTNNACKNVTDIIFSAINFARYGSHNNHTYWKRQKEPPGDFDLYYSNLLQSWVVNFKHADNTIEDFQGLVNPQEAGLEVPPRLSEWYYVKHADLFTPVCTIIVSILCLDEVPPTKAYLAQTQGPTPAPSVAPSMSPIQPPTAAPTTPPSDAPSYSPSTAPTSPPTLLCGGLAVGIDSDKFGDRYDWFRGNYRRQDEDDLIADHFWWQSREVESSRIFYSDVTFHNTWVIQSREASSYWLLPEYNHDLYYLQPPISTLWEFYTGDSVFARDVARISFNCTLSLLPTTDPTLSPSMTPTQPPSLSPTAAPSLSPSQTPSLAPSLTPTNHPTTPAPTSSPSFAPSIAPTSAPTREACDFLQVVADDILLSEFNGLYDIMPNGSNGFPSWNIINDYGTYVIEKKHSGNYWIINKINITSTNITERHSLTIEDLVSMENSYNWRPPIRGKWQFWKTQPNPTRAPTETPTTAPTGITIPPTLPPSTAPSMIPTTDPTIEPTIDPTHSPSMEPTTEPTVEPTQGTLTPTNMPTINPTLEPTFDPSFEPTNRPTTGPSAEPTVEPTKSPTPTRRRNLLQQDPPQGTRVYGTEYSIYMDCVTTDAPTDYPTTAEPTKAPTSKCEALRIAKPINNGIIWPNYFWLGEYVRMDYLINNKPWFIATHGNSTLEFIDNQWTVMRRDRDINGHDEDPILIYRNETYPNPLTWLLQSQYSKPWYNIKYKIEIIIDIICMGSIPPTPAPSVSPSESPTIETEPIWINCKNNWFTFVTPNQYNEIGINNETYAIFWDVPIAIGEDIGDVEVDIIQELSSPQIFLNASDPNSEIMIQGDNLLDVGVYTILYRAYNIYNNDSEPLTSDCEIKLYIIGNTLLDTSSYCYNQKFTVDIAFNETFYEIKDFEGEESSDLDTNSDGNSDSVEYEQDAMINIIGFATNSELRELNENCFIYGKLLINSSEIVEEEADSSAYLGIEANAIIWDLLIIVILLCLFGLCCWRLYFCRKKYKENKENEAAQALLPNKSERVMSGDSMDNNDDDLVIGDINPQTKSPGDSGSPLLSSSKRKHQPGSLSDDENGKIQWQKSQSIDEQQDIDEIVKSDTEELGGTKGGQDNDNAINALIGDAFDDDVGDGGFVTRGGPAANEGGGGGGGGGDVEMQPIQKIDSLDQGGDLPNEQNEDEQQSEPEPQPIIPPPVPPQPPQPPSMPQPVFDDDDDDEDSEFDDDSEFEFRV